MNSRALLITFVVLCVSCSGAKKRQNGAASPRAGITVPKLTKAPTISVRLSQKDLYNLSFSPNREHLAIASKEFGTLVYSLKKKSIAFTLKGDYASSSQVAFSHDGNFLATDEWNAIKIWKMPEGVLLKTLEGHSGFINSLHFSADGKYLASASKDYSVKIWKTKTWELYTTFDPGEEIVMYARFDHGVQQLATGTVDGTIRFFNLPSFSPKPQALAQSSYMLNCFDFSPDNKKLVSNSDTQVNFWEVGGASAVPQVVEGKGAEVVSCDLHPTGHFLVAGFADNSLGIWSAAAEKRFSVILPHGKGTGISGTAWSKDGRYLASTTTDGFLSIWKVN